MTVDRYAFFRIGNTGSGGGLDASLMPAPEKCGPQLVIDTDDIAAMLSKIESAGGTVVQEKTEIPGGHGYYGIFKDPNGNYLQLHSR